MTLTDCSDKSEFSEVVVPDVFGLRNISKTVATDLIVAIFLYEQILSMLYDIHFI